MSTLTVPRPGPDEAAPYYQGYIAKVGGENIGEQLIEQLAQVERMYGGLDDRSALARYAPGKWSIKELLGHLNDAERIFSYRLLRISRGDATPLPGFEQNDYVPTGRFDARPVDQLVSEFRAVRLSTAALAAGIPAAAWSAQGVASDNRVSARALIYIIVGHVNHHLGVLRDKYGLGGTEPVNRFASTP
jgi:DinB superfamily